MSTDSQTSTPRLFTPTCYDHCAQFRKKCLLDPSGCSGRIQKVSLSCVAVTHLKHICQLQFRGLRLKLFSGLRRSITQHRWKRELKVFVSVLREEEALFTHGWSAFTHDARTDQVAWNAALTKGELLGMQWYLRM